MFRLRAEYRIPSQSTGKGPENRWGLQGMGWQGKVLGSGWRAGMVVWRSSKVSVHSIGPALFTEDKKGHGSSSVEPSLVGKGSEAGDVRKVKELRRRRTLSCSVNCTDGVCICLPGPHVHPVSSLFTAWPQGLFQSYSKLYRHHCMLNSSQRTMKIELRKMYYFFVVVVFDCANII